LPKSVTVKAGDTFESLARRVYGDHVKADLIINSNPGVKAPLQEGVVLITPVDPQNVQNFVNSLPTDDENKVEITIYEEAFENWETITFIKGIDSFDQITFTTPFETGCFGRLRPAFVIVPYRVF